MRSRRDRLPLYCIELGDPKCASFFSGRNDFARRCGGDLIALNEADELAALAEETPLGRLGDPAEIAECAYFLSSDGARFITGQVIGVNGGFVI